MRLGGLQKLTLIDYPGKIAATVFTVGCNYSCPFCYNPNLVHPSLNAKEIPAAQFFAFLRKRLGKLEAVCITGGEPTLQPDLADFIEEIKRVGFLVKLDTNGSRPEVLARLLKGGTVDYVAMDIKGPLSKYAETGGRLVDLAAIQESVVLVKKFPDYEFRTTVLPRLHKEADLLSIAKWLKGSKKYFLQQFRPGKTLDPSYSKEKQYSHEELLDFQSRLRLYFGFCGVRD